jgi:hypothetical protein
MFYPFIESKWQKGRVRVGLPARGYGETVTVEARGLAGFASRFLSKSEKQRLADLAKKDAKPNAEADQ